LQHAQLGLSIEQLLLEYRALRASVLRLWGEQHAPDGYTVGDVGRFNEAIDQALAESVRTFVAETESRKQIFLAALGHDLRGPLNAVVLTTDALVFDGPPELRLYTDVLARSTRRMTRLLASLLDYNLVGLGGHMELHCSELDLGQECNEELQILSAAFPTARIEVTLEGSLCGKFDASRVREALANLVSNAVQHGVASHLVQVELRGLTPWR
jgi:signal transduction histidine kinase